MGQCQICNKSTLPDEDVELSEEKECMSKSLVNLKNWGNGHVHPHFKFNLEKAEIV